MKVAKLILAVAVAAAATDATAQSDSRGSGTHGSGGRGSDARVSDARASAGDKQAEFVVAHRLLEWETRHFNDATQAQQHIDVLKKLGAEVRVDQHQEHSDVIYRSAGWKPWRVGSDELAHQWEDWLRKAGFQTLHGHSPNHDQHAHHADHQHAEGDVQAEEHAEVVLYRLPAGASQHFEDPAGAEEFVTLMQALRCEVRKGGHAGHTDVQFRCAEWTAVEFNDHDAATSWEKWLASAGFEVEHNHDEHNHAGHDHAGHSHAGDEHEGHDHP